jgi:flagellar motor protein MotB
MQREKPLNPLLLQVLSLYLLLLAFFVVLNSIARVDEARSKAVSGSLNSTFASRGTLADESKLLTSSLGNVIADAALLSNIGKLVRTELALAKVSIIRPGRVLEISVPSASIFVSGRAAIDPLRRPLIDRVAGTLTSPPSGVRYDVEILNGISRHDELAVARSAYFASVFENAGIPERNVIAGVEQGAPGEVLLRFYVNPRKEMPLAFGAEANQ